jgi:beta-glucosidase
MGENGLRYDPEANCGENKDRSSVELPGNQREFLKRLHACGKPLVLILVSGRPLALSWEKKNLPALIMAGEPGREGGRALAEILFGAVNPSAKLTMTFPRSSGHLLQNYDHEAGKYFHTYADDESGPCFPFGHGLSYTRFECSGFTLPERIGTGDDLPVEVRVKNSGERAGEEVILLYLSIVNAPFTRPERRLVGFKRIFVNAGEEKEAKLTVCNRDLAILNAELQPVVLKGRCRLQCGNDGPVKEFRIE